MGGGAEAESRRAPRSRVSSRVCAHALEPRGRREEDEGPTRSSRSGRPPCPAAPTVQAQAHVPGELSFENPVSRGHSSPRTGIHSNQAVGEAGRPSAAGRAENGTRPGDPSAANDGDTASLPPCAQRLQLRRRADLRWGGGPPPGGPGAGQVRLPTTGLPRSVCRGCRCAVKTCAYFQKGIPESRSRKRKASVGGLSDRRRVRAVPWVRTRRSVGGPVRALRQRLEGHLPAVCLCRSRRWEPPWCRTIVVTLPTQGVPGGRRS